MSLNGQCLCGTVAYSVDRLDGPIMHCHCTTCRKSHAAAFASTVQVNREHFRWLRGEASLSAYPSSPGKLRYFCSGCGCHLLAERSGQAHVILRVATLDDDPGMIPSMHIWTTQSASWLRTGAGIPRYPEHPPPGTRAPRDGEANGETDLQALLAHMEPVLGDEEYVFITLPGAGMADAIPLDPVGIVGEAEGITAICRSEPADRLRYAHSGAYRMITLRVHSSLEAVGLTAAVAERLARYGISANMIAGYYHDHLLVPARDATHAHGVLLSLQHEAQASIAVGVALQDPPSNRGSGPPDGTHPVVRGSPA